MKKRSRISKLLLGVCARDGCENMPVLFGVCEDCHVSETKAYVKHGRNPNTRN